MLREHRLEVAGEGEVVAHEDAIADGEREAHGFVMGVPDADREAEIGLRQVEVDHAEELHAGPVHGVLLLHDADVAEAQRFDEGVHDFDMRDGSVGRRAYRRRNQSELLAVYGPRLGTQGRGIHDLSLLQVLGLLPVGTAGIKADGTGMSSGGAGRPLPHSF